MTAQKPNKSNSDTSITLRLLNLRALAQIYAERGDTAAVYECQLEAWQLLRAMQAQVLS